MNVENVILKRQKKKMTINCQNYRSFLKENFYFFQNIYKLKFKKTIEMKWKIDPYKVIPTKY